MEKFYSCATVRLVIDVRRKTSGESKLTVVRWRCVAEKFQGVEAEPSPESRQ